MNAKKGIAFILSAATCWGLLPILTRFAAANGSDAILTAAIRALVAAVFLGAYGVYKKAYRGLTWRDLVYFAIMGLFTTVGMYVFYSLSITLVSTAIAAVLLYTAPAFVILFSRLFFKETITKAKLASLLLTFLGCTLVVRLYDVDSLAVNAAGIFFGLAGESAMLWSRSLAEKRSKPILQRPRLYCQSYLERRCFSVFVHLGKPLLTTP